MIGIALDMLVLAGLMAVLQDREPEWINLLIVAVILAIINFVLITFVGPTLGIFVLAPVVVIDAVVLFLMCGLTIQQSAIAAGVLLAYQVVLWLVMGWLFKVPTDPVGSVIPDAVAHTRVIAEPLSHRIAGPLAAR